MWFHHHHPNVLKEKKQAKTALRHPSMRRFCCHSLFPLPFPVSLMFIHVILCSYNQEVEGCKWPVNSSTGLHSVNNLTRFCPQFSLCANFPIQWKTLAIALFSQRDKLAVQKPFRTRPKVTHWLGTSQLFAKGIKVLLWERLHASTLTISLSFSFFLLYFLESCVSGNSRN